MNLRLACAAWLALNATWGPARSAEAAPCGRPDVDSTFPAHEAERVPPNAELSAHYASPPLYDDEPVTLTAATGGDLEVAVRFDASESMLYAKPASPLEAGAYELTWPGLRSVSTGGVGRGREVSFVVQGELDREAPTFEGLRGIDWDLSRDRDPCLDRLEDRFAFRLYLGSASDDAAPELLKLLIFQTRDPNDPDAGPSQVALRALPSAGVVELRRPAGGAGESCFAAITQDLAGNVSGGSEREVCAKTKQPPFFEGCSVSAGRESSAASALWAALGLLLCRRGRRG